MTDTITTPAAAAPADLIQRQVDAYNAHDIEAFAALFSPDVKIIRLPAHETSISGLPDLRAAYQGLFERAPAIHCEIRNRMALGAFVIDDEHLTGYPDGQTVDALVIYEVTDGLIRRSWVIRG
jgi:hypothetical protein